jgi:hypothetical protein
MQFFIDDVKALPILAAGNVVQAEDSGKKKSNFLLTMLRRRLSWPQAT